MKGKILTRVKMLCAILDVFSEVVGRYVSWLALAMVLVQFLIVIGRYVFGVGSIPLQETIIYSHALLFLLGSACTLLHGGHVRVDIFYAKASLKLRALIDLLGSVFLLIPVCVAIFALSWTYVTGSWQISESSFESSGIAYIYLLKTMILVFCGMMILQGISMALRSILVLAGQDTIEAPTALDGI